MGPSLFPESALSLPGAELSHGRQGPRVNEVRANGSREPGLYNAKKVRHFLYVALKKRAYSAAGRAFASSRPQLFVLATSKRKKAEPRMKT